MRVPDSQALWENKCEPSDSVTSSFVGDGSLNELKTSNTRRLLLRFGFNSLLPLLASPHEVRPESRGYLPSSESYHVVVDRKGIQKLETIVLASKLCSIDTETDDNDPRKATLLGISFSVQDGEAYFITLIETDLKNLTRNDVLKVLRRIFNSDVNFIGHNIKYDYLIPCA